MAQAKTATAEAEAEVSQLRAQIADLKEDITSISKTLVDLGAARRDAAIDGVRDAANNMRDRGQKAYNQAQTHAEEIGQQAADAVRKQPAAAVGVAVGIGFLLGFISGRK